MRLPAGLRLRKISSTKKSGPSCRTLVIQFRFKNVAPTEAPTRKMGRLKLSFARVRSRIRPRKQTSVRNERD